MRDGREVIVRGKEAEVTDQTKAAAVEIPDAEKCPSLDTERFGRRHVQGIGLFEVGCHYCGLYNEYLPPSAITQSNTEYVIGEPK